MLKRYLFLILAFLGGRAAAVLAQAYPVNSVPANLAINYARLQSAEQTFTPEDAKSLVVLSEHHDDTADLDYVYLGQAINGIPVRGAVASVALQGGKVRSFEHAFLDDLESRIQLEARSPTITDEQAIATAARALGVVPSGTLSPRSQPLSSPQGVRQYGEPAYARRPLRVGDYYLQLPDGGLRLCRGVDMAIKGSNADLQLSIDAHSGEILQRDDRTVYCSFGTADASAHAREATHFRENKPRQAERSTQLGTGSYLVFPWPAESPDFGPQQRVDEPADPAFSPFGWHDTDGAPGAEHTVTRGNNAHAYADLYDNDESGDNEPDGGASLTFNFPYAAGESARRQSDAAVVNLFYGTNRMHDFAAQYGFTEAAGNFQQTNYGGAGKGGDQVDAQAQDGAQLVDDERPDADHVNNANFSTPPDGEPARMQMYLWDRGGDVELVSALESSSAYGPSSKVGGGWGEGALLAPGDSVQGQLVQMRDAGGESFTDGCEALTNSASLAGKIALVDRGTCQFGFKALQAQRAGAIGVIVCNREDALLELGAGDDGADVTIPVVMLTKSGCEQLRADVARNPALTVELSYPESDFSPYLSSSFDNGIVAHEYAHGITNRLTGGASRDNCLSNRRSVEQMGEGWSDFFALATTLQPDQNGSTPRGPGNFAIGAPTDGPGIRNYRYSTDLAVNPVTYADVADESFSQPHGVGSIWASMLWDLYWDLVEEHGRSGDLIRGVGGDNRAIALVMQGLKLQPCNPDFVAGRDAILMADSLLYGGEDDALIWTTFARRGLGHGADGGEADNRYDGTASFELPPKHANKVYLSKSTDANIEANGTVETKLIVTNWRTTVLSGAQLLDVLPQGATLLDVAGTGEFADREVGYTLTGDVLTVELPDLGRAAGFGMSYTYTAPLAKPQLLQLSSIPDVDAEEDFEIQNLIDEASAAWAVDATDGFGDGASYRATWTREESQPALTLNPGPPIRLSGNRPMLSFYQKFGLETADEGGFLEIETDDNKGYTVIEAGKFLRGGYRGLLAGRALGLDEAGAQFAGWRGDQREWRHVLVDLSAYAGSVVRVRWRAGRSRFVDSDTQPQPVGSGWRIDEVSVVDGLLYNGEAQVVLNATQLALAVAPDGGSFVAYGQTSTATSTVANSPKLVAYPNPSAGAVTLGFESGSGTLELLGANGQHLSSHVLNPTAGQLSLDLGPYPPGVYFARLQQAGSTAQLRLVRQ